MKAGRSPYRSRLYPISGFAMPSSLDEFQSRLEQHFFALAEIRRKDGHPVFALEHGLSSLELADINGLLKREFIRSGLVGGHWLAWVLFAAEQGYNYDGEEYWHSFAARMPSWQEGGRPQIRDWFLRFHQRYFGVCPTGAWASQFSIIAWPITHALLPKDLQFHLAKSLFDARYDLASLDDVTPASVGQLIASSAHYGSSRFQSFLEQEDLVGRIVLALLHHGSEREQVIHSMTLTRIVSDLDEARDYLDDARKVYSAPHVVVSRGPKLEGTTAMPSAEVDIPAPGSFGRRAGVRPAFSAYREREGSWKLAIRFPGFVSVAEHSPALRTLLGRSRINVPCIGATWLPSGWLLSANAQRAITRWPDANTCLIQLEAGDALLQALLDAECVVPNTENWLFCVGNDGVGEFVRNRKVWHGRKYLILSRDPFAISAFLEPSQIRCPGLYGVFLEMPERVPAALEDLLRSLSLDFCRSILVEPVGLLPRSLDSDASSEWLSTEAPCFAISYNHESASYAVRLDQEEPVRLHARNDQGPVFVRLDPLPPGDHTLSIRVESGGQFVEVTAELHVRPPGAWSAQNCVPSGMLVDLTPPDPTIDQLLDGDVVIEVFGPPGHVVRCSIDLFDASGSHLLTEKMFDAPMPIGRGCWQRELGRFLASDRDDLPYLVARSGVLNIDSPELGRYRHALARPLLPTRWICRRHHHAYRAVLIDDSGGEATKAFFFSFQKPATERRLRLEDALSGIDVEAPGGLFVTEASNAESVVLSVQNPITTGLAALGISIDRLSLAAIEDKAFLLRMCARWGKARIAGPLATFRRNQVQEAIELRLLALLCGKHWAVLEQKFRTDPGRSDAWSELEAAVKVQSNFGIAIGRLMQSHVEKSIEERIDDLVGKAKTYGICEDRLISEAACQLALNMPNFLSWTSDSFDDKLEAITQFPAIIRGARLIALASLRASNEAIGQ